MILESIVTSVDAEGRVNIAPMGPVVQCNPRSADARSGDDSCDVTFVLRPFDSSRTYHNLIANRLAVIHVTDDAELIARAAVDAIEPDQIGSLVRRLESTDWWVLRDCHRWFAVEIDSISDDASRAEMRCRVVRSEVERPFFGFNRAKHAVIEAAILATRTHLLSEQEVEAELDRLQPLIDKTGGPSENSAFDFLRKTIHDRYHCR